MTSSQLSVSRSLSIISFWTHALLLSVFHKDDQDLDPDKSPNAAIYKTSLGNMHTHTKKTTKNNTSEHNDIKKAWPTFESKIDFIM